MPKISVIMPVYNAEAYLREAIDSILKQTYADFEFIIIDDSSTDASPEIVRSYDDSRIRFYINEHNMGVAGTLNRGLSLSLGEYIARMDADDISLPERFEKQASFLDMHPEIGVCGSSVILFGAVESCVRTFSITHIEILADLLFGCALAHPSIMMRSSLLDAGYQYDPVFVGCEDYRIWTQLAIKHELSSIPEPLLRYRKHSQQVTTKKDSIKPLLYNIRMDFYRDLCIDTTPEEIELLTLISEGKRNFSQQDIQIIYRWFCKAAETPMIIQANRRKWKRLLATVFFSIKGTRSLRYMKMVSGEMLIWRIKNLRKKR